MHPAERCYWEVNWFWENAERVSSGGNLNRRSPKTDNSIPRSARGGLVWVE